MSTLVCAMDLDQWEPVDDINLGDGGTLILFKQFHCAESIQCNPGRWVLMQHELKLSKIMNIVCMCSRLPTEVMSCPWTFPRRITSLLPVEDPRTEAVGMTSTL